MSDALEPSEVFASALRRALDPSVVVLSLLSALGTVGLTMLLHAAGLRPEHGSSHAVWNLSVAQLVSWLALVVSALGHGAMASAVLARERGERLSVLAAASRGFARLHLVYAAQFVASIGVPIGLVLLVIPGAYLAVVLSFVTPLVVTEAVGPFDAFQRCRALIAGRGGSVVVVVVAGWLLLAGLYLVCMFPVFLLLPAPPTGFAQGFVTALRGVSALEDPRMIAGIVVARTVYAAAWAAITSVLYLRLQARERPSEGERVADVFR